MKTPEPVENARESSIGVEFDVDNALSHVILSEPLVADLSGKVIVPADEKIKCSYIDHYGGDWIVHIWHEEDSYQLSLSEHDVEWVYDSEVPEKAERDEELLEEAQGLLDDIWGETGDTTAEEATKRVQETRRKVKREYL